MTPDERLAWLRLVVSEQAVDVAELRAHSRTVRRRAQEERVARGALPRFTFRVDVSGAVLAGEVDVSNAVRLRDLLDHHVPDPARRWTVRADRLAFGDHSALRELSAFGRRHEVTVLVVEAPPLLHRLATLLALPALSVEAA